MKRTWNFGMALAFGISCLPSLAGAQYSAPYGNGALAPSGYAMNPGYAQPPAYPSMPQAGMMNGVPQMPAQMPQMQTAQYPQYSQPQVPSMHMAAYPQESILAPTPVPNAAPSVNTHQAVQQGWVGPHNGSYQPVPAPVPDPAPMQMQGVPMQGSAMQGSSMQGSSMQGMPMQSAPTQVYADSSYSGGGCAGGCGGGYNSSPVYGAMVAPTASYGGGCGPVYAQPIFGAPGMGLGNVGGFMRGYGSVPGKAIFAGASALIMTRVDDANVALTYNTAMPSENILGTRDARQYDLNGFEVFAGRYFNCGKNAFLLNYWGLYPEDRMTQITGAAGPTGYRSFHPFTGIETPVRSVYDWYDGALSHRVTRGSQYHNFEANLLGFAAGGAARTWTAAAPRRGAFGVGGYGYGYGGGAGGCGYDACGSTGDCGSGYADCGSCGSGADCGSCGSGCAAFTGPCGLSPNMCGSKLNWTWLGGFRFFRFSDDLQYAASDVDAVYNGADDIYYDVNVKNSLAGFQLGGAGTYCLGQRFNVYALTKGGVYNNHSEFSTRIYRGAGLGNATVNSNNVYNGDDYMVESSKNRAAFLGEFGTGVGARISRGWSANVGYRVVGVSGVATAVNNIPFNMNHLGNVADFNNTSSLLLHGWTIGGMYNF